MIITYQKQVLCKCNSKSENNPQLKLWHCYWIWNFRFFSNLFHKNVNQCMKNSKFPSNLKLADVTLRHKKISKTSQDNYRPITVLPNISELCERCLYNQMQQYSNSTLYKYQCVYSLQRLFVALFNYNDRKLTHSSEGGIIPSF